MKMWKTKFPIFGSIRVKMSEPVIKKKNIIITLLTCLTRWTRPQSTKVYATFNDISFIPSLSEDDQDQAHVLWLKTIQLLITDHIYPNWEPHNFPLIHLNLYTKINCCCYIFCMEFRPFFFFFFENLIYKFFSKKIGSGVEKKKKKKDKKTDLPNFFFFNLQNNWVGGKTKKRKKTKSPRGNLSFFY